MGAIVDRVKSALGPKCLPRPLATETDRIDCSVVEATLNDDCSCASSGRGELPSSTAGPVENALVDAGLCGAAMGISCSAYCLCEIQQFAGDDLVTCQNAPVDPGTLHGFCYVDPSHGNPELVAHCPAAQPQLIRFMGQDVPAPASVAFLVCTGASQ